ncbi:hypothetical protein ACFL6X_09410 [Candidatus Latescibacterota bacterium]
MADTSFLDTVQTFADNVLEYGRDVYGPEHTPLLADGINIHTHEPVVWINGREPKEAPPEFYRAVGEKWMRCPPRSGRATPTSTATTRAWGEAMTG